MEEKEIDISTKKDLSHEPLQMLKMVLGFLEKMRPGSVEIRKIKEEIIIRENSIKAARENK